MHFMRLRIDLRHIAATLAIVLLAGASAAAQMAPTRTWEELKQETQRRVDKNLGPVGGLKSDEAREALNNIHSLDRDEWAAAWSAIGDRYNKRAQSEEVIAELKAQGVEVFHTHLYKGFGMAVEKLEMEDTVRTAAIAHRLGMKIDTYIQWDTMMYETFFVEEPRAQEWFQRDASGQPIMIEYGFQQSFRYLPCFSNQEYLDYLKKVVRYAVVDVKTDFVHFDNFALSAEPSSCHCPACKTGFRRRLQTKYTAAQRKERFGFENIDYVNPPRWNNDNRPEKLETIADPVFQEWIDYRCQTMADALEQMASLIKSINPEVVVEINYGGFVGQNFPWTRGIDHARLFPMTQVFWDESDEKSEYLPDGRLISAIRTYKMARSYWNIVLTYIAGNEVRTGESLAFNQTIGFAGESPLPEQMQRYITFYRKQREFFVGARDVAPVRVLHSFASITYNNAAAGLSAILLEEALIQARVPFQIIFDEHLEDLSPLDCKTLVLPNSECLSDQQIAAIRRYVSGGGGLVVTEQSGFYDAWRRTRPESGLFGLVDNQARGEGRTGRNQRKADDASAPARKRVGAGRVAYLPRVEFDGELPAPEEYFFLGPEFWKRPANWKEIIDAVSWAAHDELELQIAGPDYLVANLVEQPTKGRRMIHLVNYDAANTPQIKDVELRCATVGGKGATSVRLYSADVDGSQALPFEMQGPNAVFTIPAMKTYCMVVVS